MASGEMRKPGAGGHPPAALESAKRGLRARLVPRLRAIDARRSSEVGRAVAGHLAASRFWSRCREVVLFASLPGEVDSTPLLALARDGGRAILLPRMEPSGGLCFVPVEDFEALRAGRYGVREPGPEAPPRRLGAGALVLVPGIAFDRRGGRLGRGGGYYDRALGPWVGAVARPAFVGVGFDLQLVDRVPAAPHDVGMDAIVTESGLVEGRSDGAESGPARGRSDGAESGPAPGRPGGGNDEPSMGDGESGDR